MLQRYHHGCAVRERCHRTLGHRGLHRQDAHLRIGMLQWRRAMSYRLACEASDVIAAVAPVDFDCMVGGGCGTCNPKRPVTEIQFRGTGDTLVPIAGAQPNFERWGEINECTGAGGMIPTQTSYAKALYADRSAQISLLRVGRQDTVPVESSAGMKTLVGGEGFFAAADHFPLTGAVNDRINGQTI